MHTLPHIQVSSFSIVSVSPLGPRIIPLRCSRVVVDKVYSAIVLALLCGHKSESFMRFGMFEVGGFGKGLESTPQ